MGDTAGRRALASLGGGAAVSIGGDRTELHQGIADRLKGREYQSWSKIDYFLTSAADGLIASPTQTQLGGTPIKTMFPGFTTVASAGNPGTLPPAKRGLQVTVFNNGAGNSMNVFSAANSQGGVAGGDKINGGTANNPIAMAPGVPMILTALSDGSWWSK
jgi:hypothetical protein